MHGDPPKFFTGKTQAFFTLVYCYVNVMSMVFVALNGQGRAGEAPGNLQQYLDRALSTE